MSVIDPIRAKRLANKSNNRLRVKLMRIALSYANKKSATFPENPGYTERIKLSETEIKTLNDALREVLYPTHHSKLAKVELGPECEQLAGYMKEKIKKSVVSNARAVPKEKGLTGHKSTKKELNKWMKDLAQRVKS